VVEGTEGEREREREVLGKVQPRVQYKHKYSMNFFAGLDGT